jgi:hypothetical protein
MKFYLALPLCLFFLLLLTILCSSHVVTITIILPSQLVPHYHWLLNFPGWQTVPQNAPNPTVPATNKFKVNTYNTGSLPNFRNLIKN